MNKTLWKLQTTGERLWLMSNMIAQQAAVLGSDGRGIAVVADEARKMANKYQKIVERSLFEGEEINPDIIRKAAFHLNLLALNSAIECENIGLRSKPAAVCVEDIRNLAYDISVLFDEDKTEESGYHGSTPITKDRIKSVNESKGFLLLNIAGVYVTELITNVKEICWGEEHLDTCYNLRGREIPLIDAYKMLGIPCGKRTTYTYVILNTPWATQNKLYAVAAEVICIFYSTIGTAKVAPDNTPLAEYIREYWESENDMPFLFMDWPKMIG
ncbi:MAG: hypothetical protein FWF79_05155 [Defluviitaleaceae bacterium]|nr:hypothetical protein [Defluviitaleaceae bacterium]